MKILIRSLLAACSIILATQAHAYDFTVIYHGADDLTVNVDNSIADAMILKNRAGTQISDKTCEYYRGGSKNCSFTIPGSSTLNKNPSYLVVNIHPDMRSRAWTITLTNPTNNSQCLIQLKGNSDDDYDYSVTYSSDNCPKLLQSDPSGSYGDGNRVSFFNDEYKDADHAFRGHPYIPL